MSTTSKLGRQGDPPTLPPIVRRHGPSKAFASADGRENGTMTPSSSTSSECPAPRHRFLPPGEWNILARGVGAIRDVEHNKPVHPRNWWWPPKGMVRGLYRDVVRQRTIYFYTFHAASIARWTLMILQLFIGATLTALAPHRVLYSTAFTVLGATATVIAGLLALLHNTGLPDRYRHNMAELEAVEDHIRELLDTSLAPAEYGIDQVLSECFDMFQSVKSTVTANLPTSYTSTQRLPKGRGSGMLVTRPQSQVDLEKPPQAGASGAMQGTAEESMSKSALRI